MKEYDKTTIEDQPEWFPRLLNKLRAFRRQADEGSINLTWMEVGILLRGIENYEASPQSP